MEIGIGIHGEPGIHRGDLDTADEIADRIVNALIADLELKSGDRVAALVNGLGATPLEELYILYRRTHQVLNDLGVEINQELRRRVRHQSRNGRRFNLSPRAQRRAAGPARRARVVAVLPGGLSA